jgi:hypothetical protein
LDQEDSSAQKDSGDQKDAKTNRLDSRAEKSTKLKEE